MTGKRKTNTAASSERRSWLQRGLRVEWLGQMAASLLWIASVLVYGISSAGDWLQLLAACSWMVANLAALGADDEGC